MGADPARRRARSANLGLYLDEPYGETGVWARLPQLAVPTLCIVGTDDTLVPAGNARRLTDTAPQARSVILPDCGRLPQFEWPEATAALIDDFHPHRLSPSHRRDRLRQVRTEAPPFRPGPVTCGEIFSAIRSRSVA